MKERWKLFRKEIREHFDAIKGIAIEKWLEFKRGVIYGYGLHKKKMEKRRYLNNLNKTFKADTQFRYIVDYVLKRGMYNPDVWSYYWNIQQQDKSDWMHEFLTKRSEELKCDEILRQTKRACEEASKEG